MLRSFEPITLTAGIIFEQWATDEHVYSEPSPVQGRVIFMITRSFQPAW